MLVSIIVPVYNVEKYLPECIQSILNQNYKDFELILVNDGSTDNSDIICDKFAEIDSRVRVYHHPNCGVSTARNIGIENAKGKWICFLDSDDYVKENYLKDLTEGVKNDSVDLVIHGFIRIDDNFEKECDLGTGTIKVSNVQELFEVKKIQNYGFPVSKLFNLQIIQSNTIKFPESFSLSEDLAFLLEYLAFCDKVKFEKIYNYYYRQIPGSLSNRLRTPNIYFNRYWCLKMKFEDFYPNVYKDIISSDKYRFSLQHTFGAMIFQSILSLYFFDIKKKKRLSYFNSLDEDSLIILRSHISKFRNPIFIQATIFVTKGKSKTADSILFIYFKLRKLIRQFIGKSIEYKLEK